MARAVRVKQTGLSWTVRKKQIGKQRKSPDKNTNRDPQMAKQPDLQFGYISLRCDLQFGYISLRCDFQFGYISLQFGYISFQFG